MRLIRLKKKSSVSIREKISASLKRVRFHRHHLYLNESDERIIVTSSKHASLHRQVYRYVLEKYDKRGIDDYLKWFKKKFGLRIYHERRANEN